jgi:hypothetical protein
MNMANALAAIARSLFRFDHRSFIGNWTSRFGAQFWASLNFAHWLRNRTGFW